MTGKQKVDSPLTFGLDIGIASVGWAVLGENRIIDLGVRCFDKAETADKGESLNLARRMARLARRRLRRRAWRLTKLARLLKREGLISYPGILKQPPAKGFKTPNPWQLRVKALDRKLEAEEWARVIYHLCKHRGFHWISRAEEKKADEDKEGGAVKKGLAGTKKLMKEKNYRSAAEMVVNEFPDAYRNKRGDYGKALSRVLLSEEFALLFKRQRELGNEHTSEKLETDILGNGDKKSGLFWEQKPALSGENLLKMLGRCTFERPPKGSRGSDGKGEYRAPKASFTAERHVWLTRLNNLRVVIDGKMRPLNNEERRFALPLPYQQAGDFTYKQLRNKLVKEEFLTDAFRFAGLSYPSARQKEEEKAKDPEAEKLIRLTGWQTLHKALKDAGLETEWQQISLAALEGKPELLDQITWVLSVYKEDEEVERELGKLELPNKEKLIKALTLVRFDKFSSLSLKALYNILPHMETGLRYDEACEKAGYHHSQPDQAGKDKLKYLPAFYTGRKKDGRLKFNEDIDIPGNPVVLRALNQTRKIVNALIKKYGPPHEVHIEMARDLSRPLDERRKIQKAQEEYRDRNDKDRALFAKEFDIPGAVKGKEFEKWQLYREQQGKCAYSIEPIDIHRLFEEGYVEIDHALPYSRSFDNSKNNKVLVLSKENRNKGYMTPYEYLDGKKNSERWLRFKCFVETNKAYRQAKRNRLLKKDFGEEEARDFRERNLNDTRYICRFFKNYVEGYLQLHENSEIKRCVVVSGQLTAFLRARWGLHKERGDSDRHHALDAAVVAACSHGMVKRLSDYSRRKELESVREGFVDMETGETINPTMFRQLEQHFPSPWPHFRDELLARLNANSKKELRAELEPLGTYPPEILNDLRPLFVSRAPQRRNGGAAHLDTIYSISTDDKEKSGIVRTNNVIQRVDVTKISEKQLNDIVGSNDGRNADMIEVLRSWLRQREACEKQAKEIEAAAGRGKTKRELTQKEKEEIVRLRDLPRKPTNDGSPGPIIRSVKINSGKMSGIQIRNGLAAQDSLVRVDVFTKADKFYLVPLYVADTAKSEMPNRTADGEIVINDSFRFLFSLYPNDLTKVTLKKKGSIFGYFRGYGGPPNPYNITLLVHDRNKNGHERANDKGEIPSIGIKTALSIEKFHVDVLGNIYPARQEQRRDLA